MLLLPVMLALTTPTGTGLGVHAGQVLHPLFSHVHLVHGQLISHDVAQQAVASERPPGAAVGAGAGADGAPDGLGLSPTLPARALQLPVGPPRAELTDDRPLRPRDLAEAPPDPPPTRRPAA